MTPGEGDSKHRVEGVLYALAANLGWGLVPLYWWSLRQIPAPELLSLRIVWSTIFIGLLLLAVGRLRDCVRTLRTLRALLTFCASAVLIGASWLVYIYAINTDQLLEVSIGHFSLPLVKVLLGTLFLRERLRGLQWLAVALSAAGVLQLAVLDQRFPWIALLIAGLFGFYALMRKTAPAETLVGSGIETALLFVPAVVYLCFLESRHELVSARVEPWVHVLLALGGPITALPLIWFAKAARLLQLSTLGFFSLLSPSCQVLLAVFAFGESFNWLHVRTFAFIWLALGLFMVEGYLYSRSRQTRYTGAS